MKKILTFALAAFLMTTAANAQTEKSWNFKQDLSEADKTNLDADVALTEGASWILSSKRYQNDVALENAELTANSQTIALTEGLKFTAIKGGLRINPSNAVQLRQGSTVTIPSLKKGQIVTVTGKRAGSNAVGITEGTNLSNTSGFESTTDDVTSTGTVTADGDVVLTVGGTEKNYLNVYTITVTNPANITIGESGYATFCSSGYYKIPSGLTAYVTDRINSADDLANGVTFKSVGCLLPYSEKGDATNYEAYLIKGEPGVYFLDKATKDEADADSIANADLYKYNCLRGTLKERALTQGNSTTYFILGTKDGNVGFYKSTGEGKLAAGKAYLQVNNKFLPSDASAKGLSLNIDGSATGINGVKSEGGKAKSHVLYNLAGQRVGKDYKGVVICNGRKYLQK